MFITNNVLSNKLNFDFGGMRICLVSTQIYPKVKRLLSSQPETPPYFWEMYQIHNMH